jgi:putative hemolysin
MSYVLGILIIFLLVMVNGLFTMSELAVVSARKARLKTLAEEGHRGAEVALDLAENPDRFLSTVQIGITLVGILVGTFSGATLAEALGEYLNSFPRIAPTGKPVATGIKAGTPIVYFLALSSAAVLRLLDRHRVPEQTVTKEDVKEFCEYG